MKKGYKRLLAYVADNWHLGLLTTVGLVVVSTLLLFKLGSLVGGLSADEFALQQQVANNQVSLRHIAHDPLYLPYHLALYLMQLSPFHGPTAIRAVGALFGVLGLMGFFYILRNWYTRRIALMGAALLASSAWFLHSARYASPDSTYLLLPLLAAAVVGLQAKARAKRILLAVMVFGMAAVYIPGVIWFLLPAIVLQRKTILRGIRLQPLWFVICTALIGLIMLAPLVIMLVKPLPDTNTVANLLALLGLPSVLPSLGSIVHDTGSLLGQIFAYSNLGPLYTAGRLPWMDVGSTVLLGLGAYQFARHYRLNRTSLIVISSFVSVVLIALGGPVAPVVLLPFLYFLIAEGLKWLLDRWLIIFPRNPLARSLGIVAIVVVVAFVSLLQLNKYFLAWGHAPETRAVFNKLP